MIFQRQLLPEDIDHYVERGIIYHNSMRSHHWAYPSSNNLDAILKGITMDKHTYTGHARSKCGLHNALYYSHQFPITCLMHRREDGR